MAVERKPSDLSLIVNIHGLVLSFNELAEKSKAVLASLLYLIGETDMIYTDAVLESKLAIHMHYTDCRQIIQRVVDFTDELRQDQEFSHIMQKREMQLKLEQACIQTAVDFLEKLMSILCQAINEHKPKQRTFVCSPQPHLSHTVNHSVASFELFRLSENTKHQRGPSNRTIADYLHYNLYWVFKNWERANQTETLQTKCFQQAGRFVHTTIVELFRLNEINDTLKLSGERFVSGTWDSCGLDRLRHKEKQVERHQTSTNELRGARRRNTG